MAAQVRGIIIERAEMAYKPETLVSAVEWPNGWGEGARGINAACIQYGVKTLAELAEFGKNAANLLKFRVAVGEKAARVNYAMRLAKGVCGQRDPDDKVNRSFVHQDGPHRAAAASETPEKEPADEQAEEPDAAEGAPRMPRPEGMRSGRAIAAYNVMDKALERLAAGCTQAQVEQELKIGEGKLRKWAKKYPDFAKLSGIDTGPRKGGRKSSSTPQDEPEATEPVDDTPEAEPDDTEPFPPFPEDEETASDAQARDYHSLFEFWGVKPVTGAALSHNVIRTRFTDKIEKPEPAFPSYDRPGVGDDRRMMDPLYLATDARRRVQRLEDQLGMLSEETARIGRDVAEALGRLWVDDASVHPFVLGLVQSLPAPGTAWTLDDRRRWIHCAETVFALMYKLPQDPVEVNVKQPDEPQAVLRSTAEPQARTAKIPARRRAPANQPVRRSRQPMRA